VGSCTSCRRRSSRRSRWPVSARSPFGHFFASPLSEERTTKLKGSGSILRLRPCAHIFDPALSVLSLVLQLDSSFPLFRSQFRRACADINRLAALPLTVRTIRGRPLSISVSHFSSVFCPPRSDADNAHTQFKNSDEELTNNSCHYPLKKSGPSLPGVLDSSVRTSSICCRRKVGQSAFSTTSNRKPTTMVSRLGCEQLPGTEQNSWRATCATEKR